MLLRMLEDCDADSKLLLYPEQTLQAEYGETSLCIDFS